LDQVAWGHEKLMTSKSQHVGCELILHCGAVIFVLQSLQQRALGIVQQAVQTKDERRGLLHQSIVILASKFHHQPHL